MVTHLNPRLILPTNPFDHQQFVDAHRILWQYNAEDDIWSSIGYISDIPLARGNNDSEGPTNGLMSKEQKDFWIAHKIMQGDADLSLNPAHILRTVLIVSSKAILSSKATP